MMQLCLETIEKRKRLVKSLDAINPESCSGLFNRLFFVWINPLLVQGFRRILKLDALLTMSEDLLDTRPQEELFAVWTAGECGDDVC